MFPHPWRERDTAPDARAASAPPSSPSAAASPYWGRAAATDAVPPRADTGFSPLVGCCFTINYILGTGFLTVPWAFTRGGLVLSTVVLVAVGLCSDAAKNFVLETMARAEAMLDPQMRWVPRPPGDEAKHRLLYSPVVRKGGAGDYGSTSTPALEALSLQGAPGRQPGTPTFEGRRLVTRAVPTQKYLVKQRKFEVNTLCRVFVGKLGLHIYTISLCLYIYCTLWAYTAVFAHAMAYAAPFFADGDEDANYVIYAVLFAAVVVPMSCMELDEQVGVQVTMTGARFLMLGLMLCTCSSCARDLARDQSFVAAPLVRLSGLSTMAPIMVFAHIYHHSIPGLSHPVADKEKLGGMFRATVVFSTVAYVAIGLVVGSAFGQRIEQSSNLNWKGFHGGTAVFDGDGHMTSIAPWAHFVSLFVLCFPAVDVVSAFPLNAITLGNNMMGSYYGSRIHEVEKNRWIRTRFRLLASIPPIIFGVFERELGTITDYAGTTGLVIGFSFPALLYLRSRSFAERKHFSSSTAYAGYHSSKGLAVLVFSSGLAMLGYVLFFLVRNDQLQTSGEGEGHALREKALPDVNVLGSGGLVYRSQTRQTERLFSPNFTVNYVCHCGGRSLALLYDLDGKVSAFSTTNSSGSYCAPIIIPSPLQDPVHCDCAFGNLPAAYVAFFGDDDVSYTGMGAIDLHTHEFTPLVQGHVDNGLTHVHAVYAVGKSDIFFSDLGDPWLPAPISGNVHVFSKSTQTVATVIEGGHPRHLIFPPNQYYFFAVTQPPFDKRAQLQKYTCKSATRKICQRGATFDLPGSGATANVPGSGEDEGGADVFISAYSPDVVLVTMRRDQGGSLCARQVADLGPVPGKGQCLALHRQPRYADNLSHDLVGVANQGGRGYELCEVSASEWGPCVFTALDFEAMWLGEEATDA